MPFGTPLTNTREELYAQARAKLIPSRLACVEAGYSKPHNAARLEQRSRIQTRIRELRHHDEVNLAWQRRLLREELMRIAMLRMPDLFTMVERLDDKGEVIARERVMRPIDEWTDDERAAISELYTDKDGVERVKPHSKTTAIDLLMKLDGLVDPALIAVSVNQTTEVNVAAGTSPRARIAGRLEAIARRAPSESVGA